MDITAHYVELAQREAPASSPEDRLRQISRLWAVEITQGKPFFADTALVPAMRALLDGYTHKDEIPDDDADCADSECDRPAETWGVCSDHFAA